MWRRPIADFFGFFRYNAGIDSSTDALNPRPGMNSCLHEERFMDRFSPDTVERLSGALGAAVLRVWGQLPHDFQHRIFEEAVVASGEGIRISLAQLLHAKHPRTTAAMSNQALVEPDSLGG